MEAEIKSIAAGSPADGTLLRPGDRLIAVNGHRIADVLDYKFHTYDSRVMVEAKAPDGRLKLVKLKKPEGADLGLEFSTYLMDKARACSNRCVFCFIDQMPRGMRKTLYFKDDDSRLSFLLGNYITLTNLSEQDVERMIKMRVSPVNVSVQTTNPELRCFMLGNKRAGKCLGIMKRLAEAGITMNCQIVSCPGINDGSELTRSMEDLAKLYPAVNSVSIVPVGLTKYREGLFELTPYTAATAAETIDQVEAFAEKCLQKYGSRVFFCGDELYIKAGRELPGDDYYEEYAQIENGVGMVRSLITEFQAELCGLSAASGEPFSIATGTSVAPFIQDLMSQAKKKCNNIDCRVYGIENDFFGTSVNVSGLVTGGDLIAQLKGKKLGKRLLIPAEMLRKEEQDFLDDVTLSQAENALGVRIIPIGQDGGELARAAFGLLPEKMPLSAAAENKDEFYRYNQPDKR